jgi:chemotaxis protein histidine kinase CheA
LFHYLKLRHPAPNALMRGAHVEDGHIRLLVDGILGNNPLMVMPVGELLAKARLFSGVGIIENGDISMLLDLEHFPELDADKIKKCRR